MYFWNCVKIKFSCHDIISSHYKLFQKSVTWHIYWFSIFTIMYFWVLLCSKGPRNYDYTKVVASLYYIIILVICTRRTRICISYSSYMSYLIKLWSIYKPTYKKSILNCRKVYWQLFFILFVFSCTTVYKHYKS